MCVGRDVPEQSMRCWPRQKVPLLPLQPLMSLAVPLQLSTLRAAVDAAAALPPPLLVRALLLPPPLLWLPLPLLRHATTNAAASCVTTAVWGSRAASCGCPSQSTQPSMASRPSKASRPPGLFCQMSQLSTVKEEEELAQGSSDPWRKACYLCDPSWTGWTCRRCGVTWRAPYAVGEGWDRHLGTSRLMLRNIFGAG